MRALLRLLAAVAALAPSLACDGCLGLPTSPVEQVGSRLPAACQSEAPVVQPQRLDILFVIDDSNSMAEEQDGVARELTAFVEELRRAGGVRQDFAVGVITTSVYVDIRIGDYHRYTPYPLESGRLRPVPDALPDGGLALETNNERVLSGDDPALLEKFARLVHQGVGGSGQETPFEAVRLALLGDLATIPLAEGGNQGFLRDGARLLVVVLSDEDDCSELERPPRVSVTTDPLVNTCSRDANSLAPVSEYHRLFSTQLPNLDGSPRDIVWAAIAPVSRSSPHQALEVVEDGRVRNVDCPTSNQGGARHLAMARAFDPSLANLDSICADSYRQTLIDIASLASVSQVLEVTDVPDGNMLRTLITRADGRIEACTLLNGGLLSFTPGAGGGPAKVQFGNQCRRRSDDRAITVQLLCAT